MIRYLKEKRHPLMHLVDEERTLKNAPWIFSLCGRTISAERCRVTKRPMRYGLCKRCEHILKVRAKESLA